MSSLDIWDHDIWVNTQVNTATAAGAQVKKESV
jgi:hypothetical protein